ncbi:MAG: hypothetical protein ACLS7Q_08780 [Varibaculum cambriense]
MKKYTAPSYRVYPLGGCWLPGGDRWFGKDSSALAATPGNRGQSAIILRQRS